MKLLCQPFQWLKRCRKINPLPIDHIALKRSVIGSETGIGSNSLDGAQCPRKRIIPIGGKLIAISLCIGLHDVSRQLGDIRGIVTFGDHMQVVNVAHQRRIVLGL